jgi:DNA invertase Pin-like site-specific DNA recombinase
VATIEEEVDMVEVWVYTPTDILIASVEAFADAAYQHSISIDTSEALHEKAKRGHAATSAPYGYRVIRIGEHSEYEKVEDEEPRVVKVFELALQGFGNGKIAKKLNAGKVPGPAGRPWSKEQIRRVLANRLYKGEMVCGKYRSVVSGGKSNVREAVPETKWIVTKVSRLRRW